MHLLRGVIGMREHTKVIHIGDRVIGGGNPILIQSMTNTKTEDVNATVDQILKLENKKVLIYQYRSQKQV